VELTGILAAAALVAALLLYQLNAARRRGKEESAGLLMLQQQVDAIRTDLRESLQGVSGLVQQQLSMVNRQLQAQTDSVGNRLDSAAKVIGDVQRNLGELGKATEEIRELGQSVSKLEELLKAPKLRGGLGEYLLEDLLKQVLPATHFEMQHRFTTGDTVDAVIRTSGRMVPVDSKFPLENFRRLNAAPEPERKSLQKSFIADVRKHIDAIAQKYILPDEGTFPFALMYVPAENVYYEIIIREDASNGAGLYSYALEKKVVPVSPNSFYAYLQVIALGLRGFYVEQRAREILADLGRLQIDTVQLRETFDVLGTHLENARKKYGDTDVRLTRFEGGLDGIVRQSLAEGTPREEPSGERLAG
jgi:DNA recombination protein RmuC